MVSRAPPSPAALCRVRKTYSFSDTPFSETILPRAFLRKTRCPQNALDKPRALCYTAAQEVEM